MFINVDSGFQNLLKTIKNRAMQCKFVRHQTTSASTTKRICNSGVQACNASTTRISVYFDKVKSVTITKPDARQCSKTRYYKSFYITNNNSKRRLPLDLASTSKKRKPSMTRTRTPCTSIKKKIPSEKKVIRCIVDRAKNDG